MYFMKHKNWLLLGLILILLVSACQRTPTQDPSVVLTNVVLTVESDLTQTAVAIPTNTPTLPPPETNAPEPTDTDAQPTAAVTGGSTSTIAPTNATVPVTGEDKGTWLSSDPPDGTLIDGGTVFTVKLRLFNNGTTTWTTDYYIKFSSGERMNAPEEIMMPYAVPPGTQVELEVTFTALQEDGTFRSNWIICNARDIPFAEFYFEYKFDLA